jgi:hypothetical protein
VIDLGVFWIDPHRVKVPGLVHCDRCPEHCCSRKCPHFSGKI